MTTEILPPPFVTSTGTTMSGSAGPRLEPFRGSPLPVSASPVSPSGPLSPWRTLELARLSKRSRTCPTCRTNG